jgi:hypothetical protein
MRDYLGEVDVCVDTAMGKLWRDIVRWYPDMPIVTIRRPTYQVIRSLSEIGIGSPELTKALYDQEATLNALEQSRHVHRISYTALDSADTCQRLAEICRVRWDYDRWEKLSKQNLQCDLPAIMADVTANKTNLAAIYGGA